MTEEARHNRARRAVSVLALFVCISTGIFIIAVLSLLLTMRQMRAAARQRGHDILRELSSSLPVSAFVGDIAGLGDHEPGAAQYSTGHWAQNVLKAEMHQLQEVVARVESERDVTVVPLYDALDAVRQFCATNDRHHPAVSYVRDAHLSAKDRAVISAQRRSACESALSRLYRDMNPLERDVRGKVSRLSPDQMLDLMHSARLEAERRDEVLLQGALSSLNIDSPHESW